LRLPGADMEYSLATSNPPVNYCGLRRAQPYIFTPFGGGRELYLNRFAFPCRSMLFLAKKQAHQYNKKNILVTVIPSYIFFDIRTFSTILQYKI
jgi:hypothetical protein